MAISSPDLRSSGPFGSYCEGSSAYLRDGESSGMTAELPRTAKAQSHLELLYSISRELAVQLDLRPLLQRVLQLTLEHIGGESGSILVLDEHGQVIEGALAYGGKVHDHTAEQLTYT